VFSFLRGLYFGPPPSSLLTCHRVPLFWTGQDLSETQNPPVDYFFFFEKLNQTIVLPLDLRSLPPLEAISPFSPSRQSYLPPFFPFVCRFFFIEADSMVERHGPPPDRLLFPPPRYRLIPCGPPPNEQNACFFGNIQYVKISPPSLNTILKVPFLFQKTRTPNHCPSLHPFSCTSQDLIICCSWC